MSPEFNMTDISPVEERALQQNAAVASEQNKSLLQKARNIIRGKGKDANPYAAIENSVTRPPVEEDEPKIQSPKYLQSAAVAAAPFMMGHVDLPHIAVFDTVKSTQETSETNPSFTCMGIDIEGNIICEQQEVYDLTVDGQPVGQVSKSIARVARQHAVGMNTDGGTPTGGYQSLDGGVENPKGPEQETQKGYFPLQVVELGPDVQIKTVAEIKAMSSMDQQQYLQTLSSQLNANAGVQDLIRLYGEVIMGSLLPQSGLTASADVDRFVNSFTIKFSFGTLVDEATGTTTATTTAFLVYDADQNGEPENFFARSPIPLAYNDTQIQVYGGRYTPGKRVAVGQVSDGSYERLVLAEVDPKSDTIEALGDTFTADGQAVRIPLKPDQIQLRDNFVMSVPTTTDPNPDFALQSAKFMVDGQTIDTAESSSPSSSIEITALPSTIIPVDSIDPRGVEILDQMFENGELAGATYNPSTGHIERIENGVNQFVALSPSVLPEDRWVSDVNTTAYADFESRLNSEPLSSTISASDREVFLNRLQNLNFYSPEDNIIKSFGFTADMPDDQIVSLMGFLNALGDTPEGAHMLEGNVNFVLLSQKEKETQSPVRRLGEIESMQMVIVGSKDLQDALGYGVALSSETTTDIYIYLPARFYRENQENAIREFTNGSIFEGLQIAVRKREGSDFGPIEDATRDRNFAFKDELARYNDQLIGYPAKIFFTVGY